MVMVAVITAAVALLAVLGEALHARRIARVARLAFGPPARPRWWARAAPLIRIVGVTLLAFGAATLTVYDPRGNDQTPSPRASRQLLIALDVSPSMLIKDAGPNADKVSRSRWAGSVVQGVLDRLDMKETRITLVAFYTKAITVLQDTTDKNVISNMFDGLQLHVAFEAGPTDLASGVNASLNVAKSWARRSTTLLVISDGDARTTLGAVSPPPAIADTIVIGVGDPNRASVVSGHSSKQEATSLKTLAARLGGYYHDGNQHHLPTAILRKLSMISPNDGGDLSLRDAALAALGTGGFLTAFIGPALMWAGVRRAPPVKIVQTRLSPPSTRPPNPARVVPA